MRFVYAAALAGIAAVATGCTIHVAPQSASAPVWSDPQPVAVAPARPHRPHATPEPVGWSPPAARPRVAASARPSAYGPVTTAPSSKPAPVVVAEPRPTQPVHSVPVATKPRPDRPAPDKPVADKPRGRYPFRLTRPEPRRPEREGERADTGGDKRIRPPIAVSR